ncbi:MAG: hypothetical protein JSV80_10825 [Acidobacteriota bacterium]|nr:MAG: hypothetical protein JSV80_10825 [Acidobacteriota bacterium]
MNWTRTIGAGVVGGIVLWIAAFVLHGLVMGSTYMKYPEVFTQEEANPLWFLLIEILIAIPAAIIFAKTRGSWSAGVLGGVIFGFWIGLFGFFPQFFNPLVIEGFPYYLAWCWAGINMILSLILGAVLGGIIKAS